MDESTCALATDTPQQWIEELPWSPTHAWQARQRTADVHMVKRILNKTGRGALTKEQKGLYKAVACDAVWPKTRLKEAGYCIEDVNCAKCGCDAAWCAISHLACVV